LHNACQRNRLNADSWPGGKIMLQSGVRKELYTAMAHIIAQPCIGTKDTACVAVCPVDCIHPTKDNATYESAEMLYIDPDVCIDCGLCVDECPVNAIFPQEDLPAEWEEFIEKNAAYFKK
jgi:ferredoxin